MQEINELTLNALLGYAHKDILQSAEYQRLFESLIESRARVLQDAGYMPTNLEDCVAAIARIHVLWILQHIDDPVVQDILAKKVSTDSDDLPF